MSETTNKYPQTIDTFELENKSNLPKNPDLERKVNHFSTLITYKKELSKCLGESSLKEKNMNSENYLRVNLERELLENEIYYHEKALAHWQKELDAWNTNYAPIHLKAYTDSEWTSIFEKLEKIDTRKIMGNAAKENFKQEVLNINVLYKDKTVDRVNLYLFANQVIAKYSHD